MSRAQFLQDGFVTVEGALDPAWCESVVSRGFARAGMSESEPSTWPPGRTHLSVEQHWSLSDVAPGAQAVLDELIDPGLVRYSGVQDNLIVNLPLPDEAWWPPADATAHPLGWHKDGDWFRHFLDSPEQALLVIVLWRDVVDRQGPTYVAVDSIAPVARLLAEHPEGLSPADLRGATPAILSSCRDIRALTGRQGTIVFAHPFMLHSVSVNALGVPRVISNSSVMLHVPMSFDRADGTYTAVEQSVLGALGVRRLHFEPTGDRGRVDSERARRWATRNDPTKA